MKLLSMFFNARDGVYAQAVLEALDRSLAVIEFKPDGTILNANKNFLDDQKRQTDLDRSDL